MRIRCTASVASLLALIAIQLVMPRPMLANVTPPPQYHADSNTWQKPKLLHYPSNPDPRPTDLAGEVDWTFDSNVRVHPAESGQHLWPDIALSPAGIVATAWMDDHAAGGYHIFYSQSSDGGVSWSTPEKVDSRAVGAYSKFVDLEFTPSGIPVVVWEDDRFGTINVFLSKRDPSGGGTPWTTNVKVNTTGGPTDGSNFMNPSITVLDDDRYFVAWTDWREGVLHQVYCRSTTDGGTTWGAETRVSDGLGFDPVAGDPCLIVAAGSTPGNEALYCVTNDWRGNVPGGRYPNVYFYRSSNGGATWSTGVRVNDIEPLYQQVSSHALVRMDDGALVAGWMNDNTGGGAHFRTCRSIDNGVTWQSSVQVDEGAGTDTFNSIATDGIDLFATFGVYDGSWNVHLRVSYDGAMTWTAPMVRVDDDVTGAAANNPVIAPAGVTVHVVWQDNRTSPFNWKTYSARGFRIGIDVVAIDGVAQTMRATPNPSARTAHVEITWARPGAFSDRITIHDATGRLVRELRSDGGTEGNVSWDGRDTEGRPAPAGVYWARVASGSWVDSSLWQDIDVSAPNDAASGAPQVQLIRLP